ncbi:MAG: YdcF family protein [Myxococcota bacterium]
MSRAIVVLGCATSLDGKPSPALQRRLEHAWSHASDQSDATLVVSGGAVTGLRESLVMRRWFEARGISPERIIEETSARSTVENAMRCAPLLDRLRLSVVHLVTERYHMYRAACLFRRVLVNVKVFPEAAEDGLAPGKRLKRAAVERIKLARDLVYIARHSTRAS